MKGDSLLSKKISWQWLYMDRWVTDQTSPESIRSQLLTIEIISLYYTKVSINYSFTFAYRDYTTDMTLKLIHST